MKKALLSVLYAAEKLNESTLKRISEDLNIPLSQAAGAATFFSAFNGMDDGDVEPELFQNSHAGPMLSGDGNYESIKKAVSEKTDILALMDAAHIRGRSGSGFPAADKWRMTASAPGGEKYIVCNVSEGEGGTYKDAALLTRAPSSVIAGITLCSMATGIERGIIYVRAEYVDLYKNLQKAVRDAYEKGILGKGFDIEVILGGGAYVSGEETGLLEALEGRRSEPRLKPPYPSIEGLFGKPTIINNAETFASVAALVKYGPENPTKLYTVTGCVTEPGVYELPINTTLRELITAAGGVQEGKKFKGFQIGGGATGSIVGLDAMDVALTFDDCRKNGFTLGTGSVRCIGEEESIPEICRESLKFLKNQSCGMCVPCRYGLPELCEALDNLISGSGTVVNLRSLSDYISQNARCALGQSAPTVLMTAIAAFPEEFKSLCKEVSGNAGM